MDFEALIGKVVDFLLTTGVRVLIALLIFIVGWKLIDFFIRKFVNSKAVQKTDPTLRSFLSSFLSIGREGTAHCNGNRLSRRPHDVNRDSDRVLRCGGRFGNAGRTFQSGGRRDAAVHEALQDRRRCDSLGSNRNGDEHRDILYYASHGR